MRQRKNLVAALSLVGLLVLWGCSPKPQFVAKHEPWRETEERACLVSGHVRENPFLMGRSALGGPSACGALRPFEMRAAAQGRVGLNPPGLFRCNMIPQVETWVANVVEPAARRVYGVPIVEMKVAASYSCRPRNNQPGAQLSEHGHANALDVSVVHAGRRPQITVKEGWRGNERDSAFLRGCIAARAAYSRPCSGPTATGSTTITSTSISRAMGATGTTSTAGRRRGSLYQPAERSTGRVDLC